MNQYIWETLFKLLSIDITALEKILLEIFWNDEFACENVVVLKQK